MCHCDDCSCELVTGVRVMGMGVIVEFLMSEGVIEFLMCEGVVSHCVIGECVMGDSVMGDGVTDESVMLRCL